MCPAASGYQNNKIILTLEVFIDIQRDHFLSNWPIAAPALSTGSPRTVVFKS